MREDKRIGKFGKEASKIMQRKIAFRAWDKEEKQMLIPTNHISFCPISTDWIVKATTYQDNQLGKWVTRCEEIFGTIPMQFTGLLDKNGKEIYEGDVVKNLNQGNNELGYEDTRAVVEWNFDAFKDTYWRETLGHYLSLEVIGNVFESPELLNP